ncbi:hypothetical protein FRC17_002900 [Serendipita sp. 399]|nr:hypothetical protein FRC17_002900 [Serendipita sp. 399]
MPFVPSPPEVALVNQIFAIADPQKLGIVTGEQGVKVFAGSNLPPAALGDIWSFADPENNGILTRKGVAIAVRLIGWAQNGETPSAEWLEKPGPLPTIEGIPSPSAATLPSRAPAPIAALTSPLPPLLLTDRSKFLTLFTKANPAGGLLSGEQAKNIFVRSKLPVERLNAIWSLVDVDNRGSLDPTQFVLAMYFIQGSMSNPPTIPVLPPSIPPFLWDQAGGRPPSVHSHTTGESLPSPATSGFKPFTPQFTGGSMAPLQLQPQQTGPPIAPQHTGSRVYPSRPSNFSITPQLTGSPFPLSRPPAVVQIPWDITADEKAKSDGFFETLDASRSGYIEGSTAVPFMLLSQLSEDVLARIWDLSDMKNDGRLTKDTFAVAMHLINSVLEGKELPAAIPATLIPPSMRSALALFGPPVPTAPVLSEAHRDLLSLDDEIITPPQVTSVQPTVTISPTPTGVSTAPVTAPPVAPVPKPTRSVFGRDLLDDEEAEERQHKQLSNNNVEIANLRNQLASTTNAQATAQDERNKLEADLATSAATLSQLQTQLASAKVGYDTETKLLAGLRERYNAQAQELTATRDELIRAESDLSALKLEKAEIGGNILREKDDVRDLKRRLNEVTEEAAAIKKDIEQAKKDARQQKGLLAIARKQLSTAEAERDAALKERDEAQEEVTAIETEIAQVEKSIADLKTSTPVPNGNAAANGVYPTSFSSSIDAKPVVGTPSMSSPALPFADASNVASPAASSKSNNPFDRFRKGSVASDSSTPFRTASPFAATSPVAEAKAADDDDPFGFNEMQATPPATKETTEVINDTPRASSEKAGETLNKVVSEGNDNLLSPTDNFFTPPTSSAGNATEANVIDSLLDDSQASNRFPDLTHPNESELPPLQEKEQDGSSDSDDDDRPLGEIKAEQAGVAPTVNSATQATQVEPATNGTSFEDAFGFPELNTDQPAPVTSSSSQFGTLGSEQTMSPFGVASMPSSQQPITNGTGPSAVSAFDEAMGFSPSAPVPTGNPEPFKFDNFEDTFNFEESSFSHTRNQSTEVPMPAPTLSAPASAAFDAAFGLTPTTSVGPPNGNTAPLSFDDAFEVSTNGPNASPQQKTVSNVPSLEPMTSTLAAIPPTVPVANAPPTTSVRSPSPTTTRISSSSVHAASPPRASSPQLPAARPRPPKETSAQKASGGLSPESVGPSRSSRLSLHFPFGRSKTTKEKKEKEKKDKHAKEHARDDQQVGMPPIPSIPNEYANEALDVPGPTEDGDVPALKQLMEYGFSRQQAVDALEATGYSFQRALNKLLST